MKIETAWLVVGFVGQLVFFLRFFVQWLASEKKKESIIPVSFWYYSSIGGIILFVYALYRRDPVFIAGQGCGILIYARNLYFISKNRK